MKQIIFSFLLYGAIICILYFGLGPVWGLIAIIIFSVGTSYDAAIKGQVKGAEMALRNPPKVGETFVELKWRDTVLMKTQSFIFQPPIDDSDDAPSNSFEISPTLLQKEIFVPRKYRESWLKWQKAHDIIAPLMKQPYSMVEIKNALRDADYTLPRDDETIKQILEAGDAGLLDTWPPPHKYR